MGYEKDNTDSENAQRWDHEYESGRYEDEQPVSFVSVIIDELCRRGCESRRGIYVGCGSGRNYAPLAAVCDNLHGIDISESGINRLLKKYPEYAERVSCESFLDLCDDAGDMATLDYLVSIQAFQHGDEQTVEKYFEQTASLLRPGGLLFLRVNSSGTNVYHSHKIIERNHNGGFTVIYLDGPKKGLNVHFFTKCELKSRLHRFGFEILGVPVEKTERRHPPKTGKWMQWELSAVRRTR